MRRQRGGGKDRTSNLKGTDPAELERRLGELRSEQAGLNQEIQALHDERQSLRLMSSVLMGGREQLDQLPEAQRKALQELRERQSEIDALRAGRDEINRNVVLPEQAILENLYMYYFRLTGEEPELRYPSLKKEIEMFRRFHELQAMYFRKVEGTVLHNRYQALLKEHLSSIEQLEVTLQKGDSAKLLRNIDLKKVSGPLEFKLKKLGSRLYRRQQVMRKVKRERGHIESFLGKGRGSRGRYKVPDLSQVQKKISQGESLSLDDLGALLRGGGLDKLVSAGADDARQKVARPGATGRSQVKTSRGKRRGGPRSPDHKEH